MVAATGAAELLAICEMKDWVGNYNTALQKNAKCVKSVTAQLKNKLAALLVEPPVSPDAQKSAIKKSDAIVASASRAVAMNAVSAVLAAARASDAHKRSLLLQVERDRFHAMANLKAYNQQRCNVIYDIYLAQKRARNQEAAEKASEKAEAEEKSKAAAKREVAAAKRAEDATRQAAAAQAKKEAAEQAKIDLRSAKAAAAIEKKRLSTERAEAKAQAVVAAALEASTRRDAANLAEAIRVQRAQKAAVEAVALKRRAESAAQRAEADKRAAEARRVVEAKRVEAQEQRDAASALAAVAAAVAREAASCHRNSTRPPPGPPLGPPPAQWPPPSPLLLPRPLVSLSDTPKLQTETRTRKELAADEEAERRRLCVICEEAPRTHLGRACLHVTCCATCCANLTTCPVCRVATVFGAMIVC